MWLDVTGVVEGMGKQRGTVATPFLPRSATVLGEARQRRNPLQGICRVLHLCRNDVGRQQGEDCKTATIFLPAEGTDGGSATCSEGVAGGVESVSDGRTSTTRGGAKGVGNTVNTDNTSTTSIYDAGSGGAAVSGGVAGCGGTTSVAVRCLFSFMYSALSSIASLMHSWIPE